MTPRPHTRRASKPVIEIKSRWDNTVLYTAENAQDVRQAVEEARASGADLSRADLSGADLSGADLSGADLSRADLRHARGIAPERCTDLLMLRDQVGKVRAYKLTTADGTGPFSGGLAYVVGEVVEVGGANTDPDSHCGAGVNLATLPWCLNEWRPGYRIFVCEFTARDIAAIPTATDGKFRTHRCKVVREIPREQIEAWIKPPDPQGRMRRK